MISLCHDVPLRHVLTFTFLPDPAPPYPYPLSLHDALPIFAGYAACSDSCRAPGEVAGDCWRPAVKKCEPYRVCVIDPAWKLDRKSTRLNSSHVEISYAVFCLKKKKNQERITTQYSEHTTHY